MTGRSILLLVVACSVLATPSRTVSSAARVSPSGLDEPLVGPGPGEAPPERGAARDAAERSEEAAELVARARQTPEFYGWYEMLAKEARLGSGEALDALVMLAGEPGTQRHATAALAEVGPAAAPALEELLRLLAVIEESSPRASIVRAIGTIGPGAAPAVGALVGILESAPALCSTTADALGRIGRSPNIAVPAIARALAEPNYGCRGRLYRALGGFHSRTAVDLLVANLEAETPTDVVETLDALGRIGRLAGDAEPVVRQFTEDRSARVRDQAAKALVAITGRVEVVADAAVARQTLQSLADRWHAANRSTLTFDTVCISRLEGEEGFNLAPTIPFSRARRLIRPGSQDALDRLMAELQPLVDTMLARGFPVRLGDAPCFAPAARDEVRLPH